MAVAEVRVCIALLEYLQQLLKKITLDRNKSHCFGFEAINEIVDRGGKFKAVSATDTKIIDIDSSKDLSVA